MKTFLEIAFATFATLAFFAGIILIISSFSSSGYESTNYATTGIVCFISSFFMLGFSYIVEASIKYLERCRKEEQEQIENNKE